MAGKNIINTVERKSILLLGDLLILFFSLKNFVLRAIDYLDEDNFYIQIAIFSIGVVNYFTIAYVLDIYNLEKNPKSLTNSVMRVFSIASLFTVLQIAITTLVFDFAYWRLHLIVFVAFFPIQLVLWRLLFDYVFKFVPTSKNVLYIYDMTTKDTLDEYINSFNGDDFDTYYNVVSTYMNEDTPSFEDLEALNRKNIDTWIINTRNYNHFSKEMENLMVQSLLGGKEIITYTSFYENVYEALPIKSHNDSLYEVLQLKNRKIRYIQSITTFAFNYLLSLLTGLVFLLVVTFVSLLNFAFHPGPLFYTQLRVGKYGKEYKIFKFRSMVVNAEKSGAQMAVKNDARITKFGKILRKFRIDELPQILSVIRGDMIFIGPRPERKVFVEKLNELTPFYDVRHLVKPGITGWAQVKFKYGQNLDDSIRKLEYDLYYIKNKSVVLDVRIIFKTLTTILFSRGV